MNNVLSSMQIFKTSEDCNKYSKSVSYETLAGGTAAIGREYKQIRRLFLSSANTPLTAVGTLTSLLCNSAKVMEKWSQISPVLRLVKVLGLVAVLSFTIISESWADDETPVCKEGHGRTVTCIEKLSDANGNNSCGDNCSYRVINENDKQVLHIYKTDVSKPASIRDGAFSPYYYADNQVKDAQNKVIPLQNIVFDNDFENIGGYAFANSGANISNANGKFVFNNIGIYPTYGKNRVTLNGDVYLNNPSDTSLERANIKGDVIISENMQTMPAWVLGTSNIDGDVIIPDSVDSIKSFAVNVSNITGKIYCASGAKACYDMAKKGCEERRDKEVCFQSLNSLSNKFSAYPDGCAKLEANLKCTKCKSASFKLEDDGWCLRKIYTPAEAAEVLNDDDTNEIVITFKK